MWDRYWAYSSKKIRCYEYRKDVMGSRHALADYDQVRYTPHLLIFARKGREVDELTVPLQFGTDYVGQAAALSETREQALEKYGVRIAHFVQGMLPLNFALYIQSVAYRWLTLWRARRVASFWI
jgi:hypothetical protein